MHHGYMRAAPCEGGTAANSAAETGRRRRGDRMNGDSQERYRRTGEREETENGEGEGGNPKVCEVQ